MKIIQVLFLSLIILGCQSNDRTVENDKNVPKIETIDTLDNVVKDSTIESSQKNTPITVMVVPCSNGYDYGSYSGDLNPFLEQHLSKDERIQLELFPLKKMKGSGFHGVYDKRYCNQILETVSVDFLIMTKMKGGIGIHPLDTLPLKWGYSTKILNTKTMDQFNGISGKDINSYEEINSDIGLKTNELIHLILESAAKSDC